jgi:quinol monooxygenase YgiN
MISLRSFIGPLVLAAATSSFPAQAADQLMVIVKVFASAGREDELQARYLKQIEYLRKAEPTAVYRLYRSAKSPTTFLWYEIYESQAAYDEHLKVVMPIYRKEYGPTPEGLIAKPSESDAYVELAK